MHWNISRHPCACIRDESVDSAKASYNGLEESASVSLLRQVSAENRAVGAKLAGEPFRTGSVLPVVQCYSCAFSGKGSGNG